MKPRVLILYFSFSNQTRRVAEAMGESFRELDWDVDQCDIEFIDHRYHIEMPFRPVGRKLLRWLLPQAFGKTGDVRVREEVLAKEYDLICIGSPTWWFNPAMPIVSFLKSPAAGKLLDGKRFAVFTVCRKAWWNNMRNVKKLARKQGGTFVDGAAFCFQGSDLRSALSFISYMENDANLERFWGLKIYEFGVPAEGIARAKEFARELAAGLQTPDDSASKSD
ncbi:MAG: flavodoxin family protein [Planctomycetota bacterium]